MMSVKYSPCILSNSLGCLLSKKGFFGGGVFVLSWHFRASETVIGSGEQGRTDHLEARALPEGPGSVGGPMRCPWYLFHRLF
ncbi:unnamed protein product [Staurois parvus]|uniref:Uncharacterized protein n=1 Tax=Staurois parvus TaxID=386267 RepID=A0ABN9CAQ1_9NEOB|nr:unnamed protein product [Staurois parvus]